MPQVSFGSPTVSGNVEVSTSYSDNINKAQTTGGTATSRNDEYTVPANKIWRVVSWTKNRSSASTLTTVVTIDATVYFVYKDGTSAPDITQQIDNLWLKAGDSITLQVGTAASENVRTDIFYQEFDA